MLTKRKYLDGDGRADYLWVDEQGAMLAFLNYPGGTDDTPQWTPLNSFNPIADGVGAKREYVQLYDLNGDGKADYLYVHPELGAVDVWWNGGPSTTDASWQWIPGGRIAEGVGFGGLQVKFGRLTTTGRYDYLGVAKDTGGLVMYQNACYPGDVITTTPNGSGGGGGEPDGTTCSSPPEPTHDDNDSNAPILIIPPPIGGEPIPPVGGGNTYTPPGDGTPTTSPSQSPTTTSPTSTPSEPVDKENICHIDTTLGLCLDGSYPVYDPSTGNINCTPIGQVDSVIGDCQRNIDANAQAVQDWLNNEKACCQNTDTKKRAGVDGYCPRPGQDPRNPPAGQCYATFTCLDALWPNVCGNAFSGINLRSNTAVLTFNTGSSKHDTGHMYAGRYRAKKPKDKKQGGWDLSGCEAEEYPWGAADPYRSTAQNATVRLIPGAQENQKHGVAYPAWVRSVEKKWREEELAAGRQPADYQQGNKIVFCVDFRPGFNNWRPEDNHPQQNYCTNPYGPAFVLFNDYRKKIDGVFKRTWDPWFDNELEDYQPRKTPYVDHYLRGTKKIFNKGQVQERDVEQIYNVPPTWCKTPSPGNMVYNKATNQFEAAGGYPPVGRDDVRTTNDRCTDYPGINTADKRSIEWNETAPEHGEGLMDYYQRIHARDLNRRAFTQGFIDGAVYDFLGCREPTPYNVIDPCDGDETDDDTSGCAVNDDSIDGDPEADPTDDEDAEPANEYDIFPTTTYETEIKTQTPTGRSGPFPTVSSYPKEISDLLSNSCQPPYCADRRMGIQDFGEALNKLVNQIASTALKSTDTLTEQFSAQGGNTVRVAYGWAKDQTGCTVKENTIDADAVNATLQALFIGCNEIRSSGFGFYGGGVIVDAGAGCVQINVYGNCVFCVQPAQKANYLC